MIVLLGLLVLGLSSCIPQQHILKGVRRNKQSSLGPNDPAYLPFFHSLVLKHSPIEVKSDAHPSDGLFRFLDPESAFIVDKSILEYDCQLIEGGDRIDRCMIVKQDEIARPTVSLNKGWAYHPDSREFLEVNVFYHTRNAIQEFFRLQNKAIDASLGNFDARSSIPQKLRERTSPFAFWDRSATLKMYSHCKRPERPFFLFATREICLGDHQQEPNLNYSEDPSIIHHEVGHFLSTILFNQRNVADENLSPDRRVSFGGRGYSEGDLISEGISDWFAHHHSGRTQVFAWAGSITDNARPVSEIDPLHDLNSLGVSDQVEHRLRYPDFINYYHYDPEEYYTEDVQQAGMIISHFLFALADEIERTCSVSTLRSRELVFYLLQETLNELGDLTAGGYNSSTVSRINMLRQVSDTWINLYTPPNIRLFAQKLGKHFLRVIDGQTTCNDIIFDQNKLEELMDSYGLLLFRTYNENGNCDDVICRNGSSTQVNSANRKRSILLPKSALKLDNREGQPFNGVFVFDDQLEIKQLLNSLRAAGQVLPQDLGRVDLVNANNNNNNHRTSPGEIIGVALNLFNDSNTAMGGVQTLANDWDHVKLEDGQAKMCNTFKDGFPARSDGGAFSDVTPLDDGDCGYITRENGQRITEKNEIIASICFISFHDNNETHWISQQQYMEEIGGNKSDCLVQDQPLSCYFRAIPGADQAWYSKLDPKSNWQDTFSQSTYFEDNPFLFEFQYHAFEVSRNLAPGTQVNCRFRARFTNCDECWHDSNGDDYLDYEFAADRPYRIFNVMFTVLD